MSKTAKYLILTLVLVVVAGLFLRGKFVHKQFDSEEWKTWVESESELSLRWDMMNSLRNNYSLEGKSKNEILSLLGEPEYKGESEFRYYLGASGFGINTGSLTLTFNERNKVVKIRVSQG